MKWEIVHLTQVDSTNEELRRRITAGTAAEGLVVTADAQSAGKGRQGHSFLSLGGGKGLYVSMALRPRCRMEELFQLTGWTAVAVCDAIEATCGVRPGIKWVNDLMLQGKKLCGILTERLEAPEGPPWAIVGVGINLTQTEADFGAELSGIAISLRQALGRAPDREMLLGTVLSSMGEMYEAFPAKRTEWLARYRENCVTLGRQVMLLRSGEEGTAEGLEEDFSLRVRFADGTARSIAAGEIKEKR